MQIWDRVSKNEAALSAALISLLAILSYALLLPQLGYYRDDWYLIWTARSMGPQGILSLFQGDRPFIGWLYILDYSLLGNSPLGWHVYAFLLRLAGAFAFWWLLRTLWPEKRLETTVMALLFVVYPGFYQQPNAATFKMLLLAYAAAMVSLALTLQAVRVSNGIQRGALVGGALLLGLLYLYIYEALIALEVVRLLLLWYFLRRGQALEIGQELRRLIRISLPYLLLAAGFLFWRLFLFSSTRRATSLDVLVGGYEAMPLHGFLFVVIESIKDWIESTFFAWSVPLYQFMSAFRYRDVVAALVFAFLGAGAVMVYRRLYLRPIPEDTDAPDATARDWIWLGGIILILTTAPIILAGRNVVFGIQWDRYTFQSLAGVALFLGGVIFHWLRGGGRWVVICGLISIGLMTQFFSAAFYRDFWTAERGLWWQLAWRAPSLRPGTTLVASLPGEYQLAEEYEVWGPLNLVYAPGETPMPLAGQVLFPGIIIELERGTVEERHVRGTAVVNRNYENTLIVSMPASSGCLHVLDGMNPQLSLREPDSVARIARFSKIDLVDTAAPASLPPEDIFGHEPSHDWCYYYQKIGLARQRGEGAEAARLADQALGQGFRPNDPSEWLPVMQAYLANGQLKEAKQASKFIVDPSTRAYLCQQLRQAENSAQQPRVDQILELLCSR